MTNILAFETSCDDTAVAIVNDEGQILGEAIFSQLKEHAPFGGVVPEVSSRAHIEQILYVTKCAFEQASLMPADINAVAATFAPGLIGPLMVGAQFAKGFAQACSIPLIAVHHIEGHIFAGHQDEGFIEPPFIALIVSGGHTALYQCAPDYSIAAIGETLDDAAGEAFDKIGRALGLDYPAGPIMDKLASLGHKDRFTLPIPMRTSDSLNFSFSGLKTKALETIKEHGAFDNKALHDFCASVREAVVQSLVERAFKALKKTGLGSLVIGGGVAANSRLRELLGHMCQQHSYSLYLPKVRHCTDNAVMIAKAAHIKFRRGLYSSNQVDIAATLPIEQAYILQDIVSH